MTWDDAQASFSRGAVSQESGSPLTFLDPSTCDDILADIRQPDGTLPDFGSIPSEPGSPPPALEREPEVTHSGQGSQTYPALSRDQATQALSQPHLWLSATQTPALASSVPVSLGATHRRSVRRQAPSPHGPKCLEWPSPTRPPTWPRSW